MRQDSKFRNYSVCVDTMRHLWTELCKSFISLTLNEITSDWQRGRVLSRPGRIQ